MNEPFPDIDGLLMKVILKEASETETRQMEEWLAEKDANRKYFEHFQQIWEDSRILAIHSSIDEVEAWTRFRQRVTTPASTGLASPSSPASSQPPRIPASAPPSTASSPVSAEPPVPPFSRIRRWPRFAAAACLIGFIATSYLFQDKLFQHKSPSPLAIRSDKTFRTDTLSDGTIVTLNRNSSISSADYAARDSRELTLQGEAFFTIASDKNRPFTVHTTDGLIRVLGTSFNVKTGASSTEVIVESGLVQVVNNRQAIEVHPHQKIVFTRGQSGATPQNNPDQLYNYYRTHTFVCNNTPLPRLVDKLNEAYNTQILIANPRLALLSLTTTFRDQSLDAILDIVAKTLSIQVEKKDDRILLK